MHEALNQQIRAAFSSRELPAGEPVSVASYDDEGTTAHFQGRHWRDHGHADLAHLTSCLTFFTPAAFCFFLPCYLLASLGNPTSWWATDVASRLSPPKNDPSRPSYVAWWRLLTPAQRAVVVSFLKLMQSRYEAIPEVDIARLEADAVD